MQTWIKLISAGLALTLAACSGGSLPVEPGLTGGQLPPCPTSPNCVSSQAEAVEQQVEPLRYQGAAAARAKLLTVLNGMARVKIVQSDPDRITAEFRSALFGFVDDVVFQFGSSGAIQVRSASRSGYYDFGVNRERVEAIRARFSAAP